MTSTENLLRRSPPGHMSGFTLIEVLVAVSIMAISVVAVLKSSAQSQDALITTEQRTTATLLAAGVMSRIEAQGINRITLPQGEFEDHPGFFWNMESSPTGTPGLTRVVVRVNRNPGEESLATMETHVFDADDVLR
ncbi:MAG: prepilin-type N-terminal cleavage/methylation domain-containing protein [Desulfovibrionales bacterium]